MNLIILNIERQYVADRFFMMRVSGYIKKRGVINFRWFYRFKFIEQGREFLKLKGLDHIIQISQSYNPDLI